MVQNGMYIPSSMDITTVDCSLVQEGDVNVDINCQTIDGKNTLHAMARVLFQEQATDKAPTQFVVKHQNNTGDAFEKSSCTADIPFQYAK